MDVVTYALLKRMIAKSSEGEKVDLSKYALKTETSDLSDNIAVLKSQLNGISFDTNENGNLTYEVTNQVVIEN